MSINLGNDDVGALGGFSNAHEIAGIGEFIKKLEKHLFSKVVVRKYNWFLDTEIRLVIEINGSISFEDTAKHFRTDVISDPGFNSRFLLNLLSELQNLNTKKIDIEEISLVMSDTSIFVQRIGDLSIPRQFDNIMRILINDYNYIVSQTRKVPTEIHIPVLHDVPCEEKNIEIVSGLSNLISEKNYFSYWALCHDIAEDVIIYDVENSDFIFEEIALSF